MSPPPFMSKGYFDNKIQSMFTQFDKIFEAMIYPSDQLN